MDWDLPDQRLEARAQLCTERIRDNPDLSFPDIFSATGELLGFYRFVNNERVNDSNLGASCFERTKHLCRRKRDILVLHDTTVVQPSISVGDFGPVHKSRASKGFLSHLSLAVASNGQRVIMGPCGLFNWTRQRTKIKNEHSRWLEQVKQSEECFTQGQAIHIMDREGDSFYNLHWMKEKGYRFIIRSCHDRRLSYGQKLLDFVETIPVIAEKVVPINRRQDSVSAKARLIHPPREFRLASLSVSTESIEILNSKRSPEVKGLPPTISTNLIRVFEANPPPGEKPIQWILLTSEPINSKSKVLKIVEFYKRRWLIEEFFKVLKTGCRLEERQLESEQSWYNVLMLLLVVATDVLNLRVSEDQRVSEAHRGPFSLAEFRILKQMAKKYHLPIKTHSDAIMVIAKMGGHIINKKYSPGWLVICRGYEKLTYMSIGYELAHQ